MIDFIKFDIYGIDKDDILKNEHLDFEGRYWEKSGEVNPNLKEATYKGLKFQLINEKYLKISGSIHKYWKGNNYTDFSYNKLNDCINELTTLVSFDPENTAIRNIEFGVNIKLNKNPSEFLKCLINHKGTPFERMRAKNRSIGYDSVKQQYTVKVYNKGLQCELDHYLLRYEIKVIKMEWLKKSGIKSLSDLTVKRNLRNLKQILIGTWDEILITDKTIGALPLTARENKLLIDGGNPKYWQEVKEISPKLHDDHRRKFCEIIRKYGKNEKEILRKRIEEKYDSLLNDQGKKLAKLTDFPFQEISQINHSSGMVKQVNSANHSVRICLYCQKPFHGRRNVAEYCSEECRIKAKNRRRDVKRPLIKSREKYENTSVLFNPDVYLQLTPEQKKISKMYEIFV